MNKKGLAAVLVSTTLVFACNMQQTAFDKDLSFLKKYDSVVVLSSGNSKVIVSPRYQAKVFTSTAGDGSSFGWINYDVFTADPDPHMNAFGGENRIWLGPEGGPFSLFFPEGFVMDFSNWKIPAAFDTEPWETVSASDTAVELKKAMTLKNYSGSELAITVGRKVRVLDQATIKQWLNTTYDKGVNAVGYYTENILTNSGGKEWNDSTGMPCIWILDMFPPSANTTIIIPFKNDSIAKPANTNYFGEIPPDRIKYADDVLFFRADGKHRSKLGIPVHAAKKIAGSYDADKRILTITVFDIDPNAKYLNQVWDSQKPPFGGDAVNAYNDGPLENGKQLGPFYELESASPAAVLAPGQALTHRHSVFHFTGAEETIDTICKQTLGVSLQQVKNAFK